MNIIYFHICTIGRWRDVVSKIFSLIKSSGLIDAIQEICVSVLGDIEAVKQMLVHPKVFYIFHSSDKKLYERPCLQALRERAETENFNVLYIHTKGVSFGRQTQQVDDWINYMCHFLISNHQRCLDLLTENHTVGVNIQKSDPIINGGRATPHVNTDSAFHYSGNFWWARSDHIKRLPLKIGPQYLDPEFWIGAASGSKMATLWQSNIDHYRSRYSPAVYFNKEQLTIQEV